MANESRAGQRLSGRRIKGALARPLPVEIIVDGAAVAACPGESIAAALLVVGRRALRASPRLGLPRGAFCMMGICQECVVRVDGRLVPACQTPVRVGMRVETGGGGG
jgi:predicted molibdopterin-dependent oxidoreductase YjgC